MAASSPFDVDDTLGAAFIGFAFSCVVFSVNTNQVVTYFQRYPQDKWAYKLIVSALPLVAPLTSSRQQRAHILGVASWNSSTKLFIGHAVYFYTITNYTQPAVLIFDSSASYGH
ncbi:hypothetical protein C8R46DRAFT_1284171 [Mycena filopes]|nr:hypothetical protein C8R46DRAFT_1284171 [Mycena filopes]